MTRVRRIGFELVLPVVLIAVYQWWASGADDPYFPPIGEIAAAFREMWIGDGFTQHVLPSLWNLARGYVAGVAAGIVGGVVIGRVPALWQAFAPAISFVLTLPPVALLPLFIVAFGIGSALQVGIIIFAVVFTVLVNTAVALRDVDPTLHDMAASFRIGGVRRLCAVLLPAAAPQILAAARSSLSVALLVMVVSELVGASRGIGAATLVAQQSFEYPEMWAGMVLLAILGYSLNRLFTVCERPLLRRLGVAIESGDRMNP
jgi:ABC-type nitrate/sulfonate/bicarbonate transport system permease component